MIPLRQSTEGGQGLAGPSASYGAQSPFRAPENLVRNATEIALALVDAAFFDLRADRVISTVDINNGASIRVLEKIGMRWEAVFRKHRRAKNRWWDCHLFVLPREVWEASRLDYAP